MFVHFVHIYVNHLKGMFLYLAHYKNLFNNSSREFQGDYYNTITYKSLNSILCIHMWKPIVLIHLAN